MDEDFPDFASDYHIGDALFIPPPPETEHVDDDQIIWDVVETEPELFGGMAQLYAKLHYPEICRRAGIQGRVFIEFVVDVYGNVQNPRISRGIGGGCDEAALAAISATTWTPGRQRGRAVPVRMHIPIVFQLQ